MRQPQRRGGKPTIPDRYKPTKVDGLATAKALILARLDRGLPCEPSMLASYGLKPAAAEQLIADIRCNRERLF